MEAIFIKNIEFEMRAVQDNRPEWIMAKIPGPEMYTVVKEGEPSYMVPNMREEIRFVRMPIRYIDEHKVIQEKNYFVKTDDRELFNDLIKVTYGFIDKKIYEANEVAMQRYDRMREDEIKIGLKKEREKTRKETINEIKSLSLWRLLTKDF